MHIKDNILSFILKTPEEICSELANRLKSIRLANDLSQEGLANRSGVSLGSLKRFEKAGKISLESLIKIIISLDLLDEIENLFTQNLENIRNIDELINKPKIPKRGKRK